MFLPAAAGFAIVQVNQGGDARFTTSGEFFVWSALIAVAVAMWVVIGLNMLQTVRELLGLFGDRGPRFQFLAYSGSTDCTPACCSPSSRWRPGSDDSTRSLHPTHRTILAIGLATAAPTVVTLWLVAERLRRLQPLLTWQAPLPDARDRVDELRTLGRCSVRSLAAASVSVSLAVLLAGARRTTRCSPTTANTGRRRSRRPSAVVRRVSCRLRGGLHADPTHLAQPGTSRAPPRDGADACSRCP